MFLLAIPQRVANDVLLVRQRCEQLRKRKSRYDWETSEIGVPSSIKKNLLNLPLEEQFEREKVVNFVVDGFEGLIKQIEVQALDILKQAFGFDLESSDHSDIETMNDQLHHYQTIAAALEDSETPDSETPTYKGHKWALDEEFGWQMVSIPC